MPVSRREKLVVVGNGMASLRVLDELLARTPSRYEITVFGAEPHPGYNRILLSALLAGETTGEAILTHSDHWYVERGIRLVAGDPVVRIDRRARRVHSAAALAACYDKLVLATGSRPLAPAIPGLDLPGVCAFRDIASVEAMVAAARSGGRAVVIGGGLLGLEAAWGLTRRGMAAAVVHLMPSLMERQLDTTAAALLQRDLERRGIEFFVDCQTEEIFGDRRAEGVRLADGRALPADLVVLAVGIRPNIDLAGAAGLDLNRGIRVGDDLRTSDPAIWAVGECAEHNGRTYGVVAPLWEEARVCAARLAGDTRAAFAPPPFFTSLKITGIDVFSVGALAAEDDSDQEITLLDAAAGIYKKLVLRERRLVGAVLYGDVTDGPWYVRLIGEAGDVATRRDRLVFGRAAAEPREAA